VRENTSLVRALRQTADLLATTQDHVEAGDLASVQAARGLRAAVEAYRDHVVRQALVASGGNRAEAARLLGSGGHSGLGVRKLSEYIADALDWKPPIWGRGGMDKGRIGYLLHPRYAARRYSWWRPPSTGISSTDPPAHGISGGPVGTCCAIPW